MRRKRRTTKAFHESLEAQRRILLREGTRGLPSEQRSMAINLLSSTREKGEKNAGSNNPSALW